MLQHCMQISSAKADFWIQSPIYSPTLPASEVSCFVCWPLSLRIDRIFIRVIVLLLKGPRSAVQHHGAAAEGQLPQGTGQRHLQQGWQGAAGGLVPHGLLGSRSHQVRHLYFCVFCRM